MLNMYSFADSVQVNSTCHILSSSFRACAFSNNVILVNSFGFCKSGILTDVIKCASRSSNSSGFICSSPKICSSSPLLNTTVLCSESLLLILPKYTSRILNSASVKLDCHSANSGLLFCTTK